MIQHKQGKANKVADPLSQKTTLRAKIISLESLKHNYAEDSYFGDIWRRCKNNGKLADYHIHEGYLFKGNQLCIPSTSLHYSLIF